jgi:hypothetical protein
MADTPMRVLVLGAHSVIGQDIVKGVLEQTDCVVTATGRSRDKLERFTRAVTNPRLRVAVLDALDLEAVARACEQADLIVNCVGPYIISGYDIARTVVEQRKHYLDFAFEQFHYRRLRQLAQPARTNDVALITGAGETVGISSILSVYAAEKMPELESLTICFVDGTLRDGESGFSGFANGALEPALENQAYVDGRHVISRMGSDRAVREFPEPHGRVQLLADPTIDSLILPEKCRARTIKSYFGVGMEIPFGFFPLMRLLNPYKHRVLYAWTSRIVRRIMRRNYALQAGSGTAPREPLLTIDVESRERAMSMHVRLQRRFNGTAILPILICRMLARREVAARGLMTAMDLVSPPRLFQELERYRRRGLLDWTIAEPRPR